MPGGMFVGTCSAPQPIEGFADPMNIDVAQVLSTGDYQGYMENDTYVASTFDSIPSGNNSWRWTTCTGSVRFLCGSELNDPMEGGDPNDPYAIIQICGEMTASTYSPYIYVDDIAIVIY